MSLLRTSCSHSSCLSRQTTISVSTSAPSSSGSSRSSIAARVRVQWSPLAAPSQLPFSPLPESPLWPTSASEPSSAVDSPLSPATYTDTGTDDSLQGEEGEKEDDEDQLDSPETPSTPPASSTAPSPTSPYQFESPYQDDPNFSPTNFPPTLRPTRYPQYGAQPRPLPPLPRLRIPPVPLRPIPGQLPYSLLYPNRQPSLRLQVPEGILLAQSLPNRPFHQPSSPASDEGEDDPPPAYSPRLLDSLSSSPIDFPSSPSPAQGNSSLESPWASTYTPSADILLSRPVTNDSLPISAGSSSPSTASPVSDTSANFVHGSARACLKDSDVYSFPPPRPSRMPLVPVSRETGSALAELHSTASTFPDSSSAPHSSHSAELSGLISRSLSHRYELDAISTARSKMKHYHPTSTEVTPVQAQNV